MCNVETNLKDFEEMKEDLCILDSFISCFSCFTNENIHSHFHSGNGEYLLLNRKHFFPLPEEFESCFEVVQTFHFPSILQNLSLISKGEIELLKEKGEHPVLQSKLQQVKKKKKK